MPSIALADGSQASGVDVSKWQGSIDWPQVAASGKDFAIVRVSDGTGYNDEYFDRNWKGVKDAGMVRGAYQFFRPTQDPVAQANLFCDRIGKLAPGDLPPVLDLEVTDGAGSEQIARNVAAWADVVEKRLGVKPIIYVSPGFWSGLNPKPKVDGIDLWVAHWGVSSPDIPAGWSGWKFWQTSSTGSVPGISGNVDTNLFNGSVADLKKYAAEHSPAPPPPPPPPPPAPEDVKVTLGPGHPDALEKLVDKATDAKRKKRDVPEIGSLTFDATGVDAFTEISYTKALEASLAQIREKLGAAPNLNRTDVFTKDVKVRITGTLGDPAAVQRAVERTLPPGAQIVNDAKPASNGLMAVLNRMNDGTKTGGATTPATTGGTTAGATTPAPATTSPFEGLPPLPQGLIPIR
ncbi:MAG: glycoside hydrolase family 25 protein [Planctomycetota bacterium]